MVMEQLNEKLMLSGFRELVKKSMMGEFLYYNCRMAFCSSNRCSFLVKVEDSLSDQQNLENIRYKALNLKKRLELEVPNIKLVFGIADAPGLICDIKRNYERAEKAIAIGRILYPDEGLWRYSQMGAFAWMDIKDDELNIMAKELEPLLNEENRELLKTLKAYLENKMNYSLTAKKLYLHINTVRKHIEEIMEVYKLDLEDPMNRLKLEILLELIV